ncbi:MAG: substrate-binding domain-containing protein, partial [Fibrella sp.]|nr:substrate-binding domain-containing protein [Armatimonadota bacterium]
EQYGHPAKLRSLPLDGALMQGTEMRHVSEYLGSMAFDLPTVYLGALRTDGEDGVYLDYGVGAYETAAHFASRGYRRVAFVTNAPVGAPAFEPRFTSFMDGCAELDLSAEVISTDFLETRAVGYRIGEAIARRPAADRPRAICCHNDVIAVGLCRALQRGGVRIPQDIAVSGFDGIEDGQFLEKPLTTVSGSLPDMIAAATERLLIRIDSDSGRTGEQTAIPTRLIIGGTT